MFTIEAFKQYKESCRAIDSPSSYLPNIEHTIAIKGEKYREISRFPVIDTDIVCRFWLLLPTLLLVDVILSPYWLVKWIRNIEK